MHRNFTNFKIMDGYSGKYYVQNGEELEATIVILKDRLSIGIRDEYGNPRIVYWPFEQIIKDQFWKRGHVIVRCGTYPVQSIELNDKEFADKLEAIFAEREKSWIKRTLNKNSTRLLKFLGVIVLFLLAIYFWFLPFLAERMAKRVPISYEERLGNGMMNALSPGFTIDAEKTAYINDFFRELNIQSAYSINITVVHEDVANAFALPGGNIVVYDKIIEGMDSYASLAALLSHEFTHVDKRHATRSIFRKLASSLFISFIFGDVGTIGNTIVSNADDLKGLSYSRNLEKEADLDGLKILSDRQIDCNGFIQLFNQLELETDATGQHIAEWRSSHPDLERRIEYIKSNDLFNKKGVLENETLTALFSRIKSGN